MQTFMGGKNAWVLGESSIYQKVLSETKIRSSVVTFIVSEEPFPEDREICVFRIHRKSAQSSFPSLSSNHLVGNKI